MKLGSGNHTNTLKRANNDITGDTIVTGKGGNEKYAEGWDAIFGKKKAIPVEEAPKACGCQDICGGVKEDWDENCFGWNSCTYCDNGYYPCNQNCISMP